MAAARVVIGYDGTDEARRAVVFAARVLEPDRALVVHVFSEAVMTGAPPAGGASPALSRRRQADIERHARAVAEEGMALARSDGLEAVALVRRGMGPDHVARVLHDVAECFGAEVVVIGHRHASPVKSALLGSVSVTMVRDERAPVPAVPT